MIDGVQNQALVLRSVLRYGSAKSVFATVEAGLQVYRSLLQVAAEAKQALRGDRGGGAVHRLMVVERVGGFGSASRRAWPARARRYPNTECHPAACSRCRNRRWLRRRFASW